MANAVNKRPSTQSKEGVVQTVVTEDSIQALNIAMSVVKKEYGEFKLTQDMRQNLAKELGVSEESADGWQTVVDILDHIDLHELAKKHPDKIGMVSKTIVGIITCFFPAASVAALAPEDFLAKMVEFAGILTPEHLVKIFAQKQIERNKEKREQAKLTDMEQPSKFAEFKSKLSSGYKNTAGQISGFFAKKYNTPTLPKDEDIFESIRKLAELEQSGIITQEEFDSKKTELLNRL